MKKVIKTFKLRQSMSRADDPYHNAWAESFLEQDEGGIRHAKGRLQKHREIKSVLFEYIDGYYNTRRLHSSLNYLKPVAFEIEY